MLPWIIGGVIGATITAVVFYNEEEREKALIAQEDAEADNKTGMQGKPEQNELMLTCHHL